MKDSVAYYAELSGVRSDIVQRLGLAHKSFVLATIHRQENTDNPNILKGLFQGINEISSDTLVVMPLHPRTRAMMKKFNIEFKGRLIDPVGYFDMLQLLKHCKLVVTDSGGLQKEAFFNQKPCIIAREQTEWTELVDNGFALIAGSDPKNLKDAYTYFVENLPDYKLELYGDEVGLNMYKEILNYLK
jgi:UDP-GlcNAc3NAcA epimerase